MKSLEDSVWGNDRMNRVEEFADVVIVGAGHAGCEAALACARLGMKTVMFTVSVDSIALMPCNPNIGGSSKGHLVREIDALGGEMGKNIDRTFIQSKMLNQSKGPAVHSLRAQADKADYSRSMRQTLERTENLRIRQMEVTELIVEKWDSDGSQDVFRCSIPLQSSSSLYGNVPEGKVHLRGYQQLYGTKRTAGSQLSHGFSEEKRCENVSFQDGYTGKNFRKIH